MLPARFDIVAMVVFPAMLAIMPVQPLGISGTLLGLVLRLL